MTLNLFDYPYQYKVLDNGKCLLVINQKYFTVEAELLDVLKILKNAKSFEEATGKYNSLRQENHSIEDFQEYAKALIESLNLEEKESSFLLWEYSVLSPEKASSIAQYFKFLFKPVFFFPAFTILFFTALYIIFGVEAPKNTTPQSFLLIIALYAVSTFFHELGHIASCNRFTGKNGEIGIGIYIFYPIFYSNISAVWMADKKERIITNLAGIYMQLILAALFLLSFIISGSQFSIEFAKVLVVFGLFQILPFIRSDGYWILIDILNEPNLLKKSNDALWNLIKNLFGFKSVDSNEHRWLAIYSIFNFSIIFYFLYFQLKNNRDRLFDFPFYVVNQMKNIFSMNFDHVSIEWGYMPVIVFYFILYQYGKKILKLFTN